MPSEQTVTVPHVLLDSPHHDARRSQLAVELAQVMFIHRLSLSCFWVMLKAGSIPAHQHVWHTSHWCALYTNTIGHRQSLYVRAISISLVGFSGFVLFSLHMLVS